MKKARAEDHWRRLLAKAQPSHARSIAAVAIANFPVEPIRMAGPITVLTGLNGVGKSTILNSVRILTTRGAATPINLALLKSSVGQLNGEIASSDGPRIVRATLNKGDVNLEPETIDLETTWIDNAFEIPALIKHLREEQNLGEALDQVSPIVYSPDELMEISWLVGKDYSSCSIYELEGFYGRTVAPYFFVESSGSQYGSECMGLGEMSLHYVFWSLKRAEKDSLILFEEPETYVSSRSQAALMDCLAHTCLTRNCTAIVTTHSPQIFAQVPPRNTLIIVNVGGATKIITKDTGTARLTALSVPPVNEKAGYLLVEDRMAREFAKSWLHVACPNLMDHWRVVDMSSASHIIKTLDSFPSTPDNWFRAVGLLDGDERHKNHQSEGLFSFLPTQQPPEIFLRQVIHAEPVQIAQSVGIDADEFQISLAAVEGLDHHDWFIELVKLHAGSGLTFENLVEVAAEAWVSRNPQASSDAARELLEIISAG